jgi:hypothetical protein
VYKPSGHNSHSPSRFVELGGPKSSKRTPTGVGHAPRGRHVRSASRAAVIAGVVRRVGDILGDVFAGSLRHQFGKSPTSSLLAMPPAVMPPAGLEPATIGLEVRRSVQLSYGGVRETVDVFGAGSTRRGALLVAAIGLVTLPNTNAGAAPSHPPTRPCLVPGVNRPLDQVWRPDIGAAIRYIHVRAGDIAFAVRTDHHFYGYRPNHVEWSASVLKPMLMAAYLDRRSVAHRALNRRDRSLLDPMITRSDNAAATEVLGIDGDGALYALAHRVGMTQFALAPIWGESHITARDQTKFFCTSAATSPGATGGTRCVCSRRSRPLSAGESGTSRPRAGSSISRVAGVREPASSTTRWRCWSAGAHGSR